MPLCVLDLLSRGVDVALVVNILKAFHWVLPRLFGKRIAINVDGIGWKRDKWGTTCEEVFLLLSPRAQQGRNKSFAAESAGLWELRGQRPRPIESSPKDMSGKNLNSRSPRSPYKIGRDSAKHKRSSRKLWFPTKVTS
jgi:hypothetical protein